MTTLANLTTYISGESASFLNTIETTRGGLRRLVASLDPVAAATAKYNRQVEELDRGLKRNQLTLEQHAGLTQRLSQRYQEQIAGQTRVTASSGQMRAGMQQLSYQIGDVSQQFAVGTAPMVIFAQQGGQVIQAIQMMSKSSGGLIGFLAGPWGAALTGAAMILGTLASKYFDGAEAAKVKQKAAEDLKAAMDNLYQSNMRVIKSEQMLQAETQRSAFADFQRAQKAIENANKEIQAQKSKLSAALITQANAGGTAPGLLAGVAGIGAANARRDLAALDKLQEENRKRLSQQWEGFKAASIPVLQGIASETDKATASDRRHERAMDALNKQYTSGKISRAAYISQTQRLTATHDAEKEAIQKASQSRNGLTDEERAAAKLLREREKDEREYQQTLQVLQDKYDPLTAATRRYREELSKIAALKGADAASASLFKDGAFEAYAKSRADILGSAIGIDVLRSQAGVEDERAKSAQSILDSQAQAIVMAERELSFMGTSDKQREKGLARARLEQQLRREGIESESAIYTEIMQRADAYDVLVDKIRDQGEALDHLRDVGGSLIDEVFDPNTWNDWGQAGKRIIDMIMREMLTLAAINPLKNMLFGQSLPTLSLGGLGGLFGMGGGSSLGKAINIGGLRGLAAGEGIPGAATGGSFLVGGASGTDRNMLSINGIPRVRVSATERVTINPANDNSSRGGIATIIPSPYFDVVVDQRATSVAAPMSVQAASGGSIGAQKAIARSNSRRLA